MNSELQKAFQAIGADLLVDRHVHPFSIDITRRGEREVFQIQYSFDQVIEVQPLDVKPRQRHLVLDVFGWQLPISVRYLCGHDESHWFVAGVPLTNRTATVRGAMEALKPQVVLREQQRRGVSHRRNRRKTAAYIRQGEWFFVPRPKLHVNPQRVIRNGRLVRNHGKPHLVAWLYRDAKSDHLFARGDVRHPDHSTIHLATWHRVIENREAKPSATVERFIRMGYLD